MASVSLVTESLPERELTEQALSAFGRVLNRSPTLKYSARLLQWPAVHVVSTVRAAVDHYEQGTFWPKLAQLTGLRMDAGMQSDWGRAFLANLKRLGLPLFDDIDDVGAKFVGRILMHAGMPTYCLNDYFDLISERRRRIAGLEPDEFVSWAGLQAAAGRLTSVDTPVRRFLRYGGEYAVDVADRVFELLDVVVSGGDGGSVPLPVRFLEQARQWADEERSVNPSTRATEASAVMRPQLVLDPYGRGPLLRMPPVAESDGRATWVVTIGSRPEFVSTAAVWPGAHEPAPSIDVPVVAPVRAATIALRGYEQHQSTVTIVDDKAPLLAFSDEGRLIPAGLPLRGGPVWLLFPGDPESLSITGAGRTIAEGTLPPGWAGWCLLSVDLSDATSISLAGISRTIRRSIAARIVVKDPIGGLRSRSGLPVFAERPLIELPPGQTTESGWSVTISDGAGLALARRTVSDSDDAFDVWSDIPGSLIGTYTVRVRGPWGRGATRQLELLEGARLQMTPPWRRMTTAGLLPARAILTLPEGYWRSPQVVDFGSRDTVAQVQVAAAGVSREYRLEPPHMSVSYQSTTHVSAPTILPISLFAEDITEDPGVLTVHIGEVAEPTLYVRSASAAIQHILPGAGRSAIYPFRLSQLTDTLRTMPLASLSLDENGLLTVARIRPRHLFTTAWLEAGALNLSECRNVDGLTALVYPTRAPWRGATRLPVSDGCVSLPEFLINTGPMFVTLTIEDPWVPADPPSWPRVGEAQLVDGEGYLRNENPEESALSAWLAGEGELPDRIDDLSRLWIVLDHRNGLALGERRADITADCLNRLREAPGASLDAVPIPALDSNRLPALLVDSGLLAHPGAAADEVFPSAAWTRPGTLVAVVRWATALVGDAGDTALRANLMDDARTICGDCIDALVVGRDPSPRAGRFDQNAAVYARMGTEARLSFRSGMQLVPKGLLDQDSRVQASLELLEHYKDLPKPIIDNASERSTQVSFLLDRLGDKPGASAFAARRHPTDNTGWRALPSLSLGFALAARHAARGRRAPEVWLSKHRREWAYLARVAPNLVTIDLTLAELILSAHDQLSKEVDA